MLPIGWFSVKRTLITILHFVLCVNLRWNCNNANLLIIWVVSKWWCHLISIGIPIIKAMMVSWASNLYNGSPHTCNYGFILKWGPCIQLEILLPTLSSISLLGPFDLHWLISFPAGISNQMPIKCEMKLLIHSATSMVYGNGYVISSHIV